MQGLNMNDLIYVAKARHEFIYHMFSRKRLPRAVTPARAALLAGSHSALCKMDYPRGKSVLNYS